VTTTTVILADDTVFAASRIIGIRPRVKKTKDGEARPTQVVFLEGSDTRKLDLEDADAELDFARGRLPIKWRDPAENEDVSHFPAHHCKKDRVPCTYEGLRAGDLVVMTLGGSGDRFAFSLARNAARVGAEVARITPATLKELRGEGNKDDDADTLALAAATQDDKVKFWPTRIADMSVIELREKLTARTDAMQARIACEQRLYQRLEGRIFLSDEGGYPEGKIKDMFDAVKANDKVLQNLLEEEAQVERDLVKHIETLGIYQRFFAPIEGVGPMIAARIISSTIDIRRFRSDAAFKKYMGLHVREDGSFPSRRRGQRDEGSEARLPFYLIADQFNRRPNSPWGQKLLENKAKIAERVEAEWIVACEKATANGEELPKKRSKYWIMTTARWRTLSQFARKLWRDWHQAATAENGAFAVTPQKPKRGTSDLAAQKPKRVSKQAPKKSSQEPPMHDVIKRTTASDGVSNP